MENANTNLYKINLIARVKAYKAFFKLTLSLYDFILSLNFQK